ncbi:peptidylprolyl isomerase [Arthrobacter sp. 35W]|uniref:peptidylprolyl isomerase n=1 Tax=Arthrobacter sp. 35W TaxID=1132441 RepID=UPI000404FA3E|nr:peptidylprolyl isomerase [Arthrobacter sp. 35W]
MVSTKRDAREAKKRVARMQANQQLQHKQVARRKRDNLVAAIAIAAALALAVVLQITVFSHNPSSADLAAAEAGLDSTASPSASASPTSTAPPTNGANIPLPETAAGKTFTGQLSLNGSALGVEVDGTTAPQAAAVFKSLADQGFFTGKTCHRLTTADNFGVLQCGSLNGDGIGDPSYQWGPVENTPANGIYPAGTIAVARAGTTYSNGTQFFIVYKDTYLDQASGGYTILGKVTSGLDAITAIAGAGVTGGTTDGAPVTAVTIDSFTLN